MLFGKRDKQVKSKTGQAKASSDSGKSDSGEEPIAADRALDFMAEMLRILGERAFDIGPKSAGEIEIFFETWARHLLVGVAPPGREMNADEDAAPDASKRDLPGLRRALRDHRDSEKDYVTTSLGDFRDATWSFISGLRRSLSAEQSSDRQISHRMRRL